MTALAPYAIDLLSSFAEVVDQADGRRVVGVEAGFEASEQGGGGRLESVDVRPEAVTGELLLEEAPDPLDQVEGRRVRRQPEGNDPAVLCRPPRADRRGPMITDVVHHQHQGVVGPGLGDLIHKRGKGVAALAVVQLPGELPRGVVQRAEDRPPLVFAGGGNPQRPAAALPDLDQVGVGMQIAFIDVDEAKAGSGSSPLFWSSASACLADATASASWRWVRSCRGRR